MRARLAFQAACTYIGTVVGAGFASGQEVYQFFGRYHAAGFLGIAACTLLLGWMGARLMALGHRLQASSFRAVTAAAFGAHGSRWTDGLMMGMLFGVMVAMVAGAGELLREQLAWPYALGAIFTMVAALATVTAGISGVLGSNAVIVPCMAGFVLVAGVHAVRSGLPGAVAAWNWRFEDAVWALGSAVLYAAFNVGLSMGVLIPLGAALEKDEIRFGAWGGACGLGVMLAVILATLYAYAPAAMQYQVPMGFVAAQLGGWIQAAFLAVLWAEVYSTLVGDLYAWLSPFPTASRARRAVVAGTILAAAFGMSLFGFARVVQFGYPLFGWISLVLLFGLFAAHRRMQRTRT
ncbi:membrane protein [Alicyclobacillus cellulosilyticus]|uniref:Membrane protein n=1 Tax=Alicyclobacillus cellulosilyticus TaxID=1003997 RepID=A0A917KBN0_9BACL|nr:hypothetical protein [Alicyclobacillus cellulosilyticus]GGJ07403.1 membrane protein [Alicyclobacillus cellulosilyticus]